MVGRGVALAVGFRFFSDDGWPKTITWDTDLGGWGGTVGSVGNWLLVKADYRQNHSVVLPLSAP